MVGLSSSGSSSKRADNSSFRATKVDSRASSGTGASAIIADSDQADQVAEARCKQRELGGRIAADWGDAPARPFEIYVHVPFCLRRCGYCDFNTYTARDLGGGASRANYAAVLIREMKLTRAWQEECGIAARPVSTMFFGGGTPTILPAADLVSIVAAARRLWGFAPDIEITTEANPDTVDGDYIAQLAAGGFTRISFGMQSAVPHVLRTLDRTHDQRNVVAGVEAAKRAGLRSSVDLIYGAPGESLEDWKASLEAAIALGTNHVSCYALTVAPRTKMGRRIAAGTLSSPSDDDEAAKYELADRILSNAGFTWYEISNWARGGDVCRHNIGYWRNDDWAGFGPGAHAHWGNARAWDIAHPKRWALAVSAGVLPWAGSEWLDRRAQIEEQVMLGLRLNAFFDLADVERLAGASVRARTMEELVGEGLIERDPVSGGIKPTVRGRLLNDIVIEKILDDLLAEN